MVDTAVESKVHVTFRLDRDLVERMEKIKEREGVPKAWQVTKALRDYLEGRAGA